MRVWMMLVAPLAVGCVAEGKTKLVMTPVALGEPMVAT